MRLIDADMLEQAIINAAAFESKLEWNINELKRLIRKQPTVKEKDRDGE